MRHEVTCPDGARLLTIFTPGGFDQYLAELAALSPAERDDADRIRVLGRDTTSGPGRGEG